MRPNSYSYYTNNDSIIRNVLGTSKRNSLNSIETYLKNCLNQETDVMFSGIFDEEWGKILKTHQNDYLENLILNGNNVIKIDNSFINDYLQLELNSFEKTIDNNKLSIAVKNRDLLINFNKIDSTNSRYYPETFDAYYLMIKSKNNFYKNKDFDLFKLDVEPSYSTDINIKNCFNAINEQHKKYFINQSVKNKIINDYLIDLKEKAKYTSINYYLNHSAIINFQYRISFLINDFDINNVNSSNYIILQKFNVNDLQNYKLCFSNYGDFA